MDYAYVMIIDYDGQERTEHFADHDAAYTAARQYKTDPKTFSLNLHRVVDRSRRRLTLVLDWERGRAFPLD